MTIKKLLVFSVSIGSGHNQAAKAFISAWNQTSTSPAIFVDFLESQTIWDRFSQRAYEWMIQHLPWCYDFLYRVSDLKYIGTFLRWQTGLFCAPRLLKYIQHYESAPAALVFTHPTPANAAAALKRKGKITAPLIGIVTDFSIHELWKDPGLDLYIIPHEKLSHFLTAAGIPKEKILCAGIPVGENFWDLVPSAKSSTDTPHFLVAGGGWGMGPLKETIQILENLAFPCKITLVTGRNRKLKEEMDSFALKSKHPLEVIGFTKEMHQYMQDADLFITKAGGLSTSESFACGTPLLLLPGRAGQEEDNCQFFSEYGAALYINHMKELPNKMEDFLRSENLRQTLFEKALELGTPSAARNAAKAVSKYVVPK